MSYLPEDVGRDGLSREGPGVPTDATIVSVNSASTVEVVEVVHHCPIGDAAGTACCGRSPFELPRGHRLTLDPALVTCGGVVA